MKKISLMKLWFWELMKSGCIGNICHSSYLTMSNLPRSIKVFPRILSKLSVHQTRAWYEAECELGSKRFRSRTSQAFHLKCSSSEDVCDFGVQWLCSFHYLWLFVQRQRRKFNFMEGLFQECRRYGKGFHSSFRQYLEQWGLFPIRTFFFLSEAMLKLRICFQAQKGNRHLRVLLGLYCYFGFCFLNYLTRSVIPQKFKLR